MTPPDKVALLDELRAALAADLDNLERSQRDTQEAATHEEARPENDKDTRALEQSYLARGLAERVAQLRAEASKLSTMNVRRFGDEDAVAMGALASVEDDDGGEARYFVAPVGGGRQLAGGVVVVTPESPLGRALLGARVGDEVVVPARGGRRGGEVVGIR